MTDQYQIADQIQSLSSDQVKSLVLAWLGETDGGLDDFGYLLETEYTLHDAGEPVYGDVDEQGTFQPLTDTEMAAKSLEVLEEYRRTHQGVPHEQVRQWLGSVGTDHPLPYPK